MSDITIYTDGSCLGNPGRGGYAAVLISGKHRKEISGGFRYTTNNRMELLAVIKALEMVKDPSKKIKLYTDSNLIVNTINKGWIYNWKKKGWKKSSKKTPENLDLLKQLYDLIEKYDVEFEWIKAHVGTEENERCDELAKEAAEFPEFNDDFYEMNNNYKQNDKINIKSSNNKITISNNSGKLSIDKSEVKQLINSLENYL